MKRDNERVKNRTVAKTEIELVKFVQRQKRKEKKGLI